MAVRIRSGKRDRRVAGVSMAPMIDMVFLLLVFFMTASAMSQAGTKVELDLPVSPVAQVPKDLSSRLIISIDAMGNCFLGTRSMGESELRETFASFANDFPQGRVNLRAHRATEFSFIRKTMNLAAEAGLESFLYATYQGGD